MACDVIALGMVGETGPRMSVIGQCVQDHFSIPLTARPSMNSHGINRRCDGCSCTASIARCPSRCPCFDGRFHRSGCPAGIWDEMIVQAMKGKHRHRTRWIAILPEVIRARSGAIAAITSAMSQPRRLVIPPPFEMPVA